MTIEQLPDNTPVAPLRVTLHNVVPDPTTVPTRTWSARAALANPATADRATQLTAHIANLEAELVQARTHHSEGKPVSL